MRFLALDVGDRRIGLATGDDAFGIVRALATLRRRSVAGDLATLREIVRVEGVERLVIGLPLTERGAEGEQAARAKRFADACAALDLPIDLVDERFTTTEAAARGARDLDAGAASVLLEGFLRERSR
ncbi:MAG: Holliday junction resolvase RuvX [Chloroflexi bacterium]|nr:Holliday junction resolvase RuvX [Chloroflexota bacterium]